MALLRMVVPFLFLTSIVIAASNAPRISVDKAKKMLGKANVVILDVRTSWDWRRSKLKIKGAIRENYKEFESWYSKYPKSKTYILYCA